MRYKIRVVVRMFLRLLCVLPPSSRFHSSVGVIIILAAVDSAKVTSKKTG